MFWLWPIRYVLITFYGCTCCFISHCLLVFVALPEFLVSFYAMKMDIPVRNLYVVLFPIATFPINSARNCTSVNLPISDYLSNH